MVCKRMDGVYRGKWSSGTRRALGAVEVGGGGGGCVWTRLDESVDKGRMSDQARWKEDGGEGEECGTAGW